MVGGTAWERIYLLSDVTLLGNIEQELVGDVHGMYFPAGVAKLLCYGLERGEEPSLIRCNSSNSHFLVLTSTFVYVWSVRVGGLG